MAHKQKILIVEDNADGRELFALYIRRLGYEVFEAATGLEALDQAHAVHPDLILMDLALPKMPGYEATASQSRSIHARYTCDRQHCLSQGTLCRERYRRGRRGDIAQACQC